MTPAQANVGRLVYVISRYPAMSHAFISRELDELRTLGAEIDVVSLRSSRPIDLLTPDDRRDRERVLTLRAVSFRKVCLSHLSALGASTRRYVGTGWFAFSGGIGLADRLKRLGHFHLAVLLWHHARSRGCGHLHAHFERPAADIAMLAARLGGEPEAGRGASPRTIHSGIRRTCADSGGRSSVHHSLFA